MSKLLAIIVKVWKAYSLEEKVLSLVFLVLTLFFSVRGLLFLVTPGSVFAETGVYAEGMVSAKPVLINPLYTDFSQANRDVSALVFSGLLKYDPKVGAFVDDLASLRVSEDGKEYFLTLREGAKWHDGQPVVVEDVLFTFSVITSPQFQNTLLKANFDGVKIERADDRTVRFTLSSPNSFFITTLNVGILPAHLLSEVDVSGLPTNKFNLQPVGTGPYRVASPLEFSNDGKQRVVLSQFQDYYGVKPAIREIRLKIYPDEESLVRDRQSLDIVARLTGKIGELVYDNRFQTVSYALPQYLAVFYNTESGKLRELKLRIALSKLIDKDELVSKLENKIRVDTPLLELDQKDWLNKPDLNEANGALFDAGYKFKKDEQGQIVEGEAYRKDKDGKELELTLTARKFEEGTSQDLETRQVAEYLIESWKKGGVKVNLQFLGEQEYLEALKTKQYDMIMAGQSMGYNLDTYTYWHSSQVKEVGLNLSRFMNLAADQQIEKIRATFDKDEKQERQTRLAEIIAKEVPALFLYRPNYLFLTDGKVKNISLQNLVYESDRFVNIADWCIGNECK